MEERTLMQDICEVVQLANGSHLSDDFWGNASIVSEVVSSYPVPVERLTQDEKMEIMAALNRKGVFLLKGSVSYVAKELHSSEASIYRYLGKLNNRA